MTAAPPPAGPPAAASPAPPAADVVRTQSAAGRGERLDPPRSSRIYWHLTQLRAAYEAVAATLPHGGRLLDYGCGNMPYRPLFEGTVAEYVGADLPGNELAGVTFSETGRIDCEHGAFDVVLSSQVLEHVADPDFYLSEARRVLKPGGTLLLSTHGVWRYHPDPRDLWRWTCDGLRTVIERNGFAVASQTGVMGPAATGLQLWQDALLARWHWRLGFLKPTFTRWAQRRIEKADRRCPDAARNRDACVYLVTARAGDAW